MKLIDQLQRSRKLHGTCPCCDEDFRLSDAVLFHARGPYPEEAQDVLHERQNDLKEGRAALRERRKAITDRSQVGARSVNIGKIVEKIAPTFPTFSFSPRDCRALFEPIDYVAFPGLDKKRKVEAICLMDVKSGSARLTAGQREIRDAVVDGKVRFKNVRLPGRK